MSMTNMTIIRSASDVISARKAELARAVVDLQYRRQPEVWQPYGEAGREKSVRDVTWHLSYLSEALALGDASLFVQYAGWTKSLFAGLKFTDAILPSTLECVRDVLRQELSVELGGAAAAYLEEALAYVRESPAITPSFLDGDTRLADLARRYLDLLLKGNRHLASRLILDEVERGATVRDIYMDVFQPAQREVGRLWQINRINVAQEHYCTAATQLIMAQLYPRIFSGERNGHRLVATCVGGELHEIGVRMVADFFEMDGWDTYYLGANAPAQSVAQAVADRQADVLAISATMTFHVRLVADLIATVRASEAAQGTRILVGGYPFNLSPDLWRQVGADGYAPTAEGAIATANQMVGRAV